MSELLKSTGKMGHPHGGVYGTINKRPRILKVKDWLNLKQEEESLIYFQGRLLNALKIPKDLINSFIQEEYE